MASLPVYVRPIGEGHVSGVLADFPGIAATGESSDSVLAALEPQARRQMRKIVPALRKTLAEERDIALRTVRATARPQGRHSDELDIDVTLIVWQQQSSAGLVHVVRAPGIPSLDLTVGHPGDIDVAAKRAVTNIVRHWSAAVALGLHEPSPGSLMWIDVPLTMSEQPQLPNDPDFSIEETAQDLTMLARAGTLGRLDQRDPLVERVLAAFAASGRRSVLLVGAHDVGKSALIGEVAARMAAGQVPPALHGRPLLRLSANDLIAGARYTGMWQGRARALIDHARTSGAVYVMGDPAGIVDAGRWSESSNNLSRVLGPLVASGEITLVCETSPEALSVIARKEPSFIEMFHRIDLHEPDHETAETILAAAAGRLSAAHGIEVDASAVSTAIGLTTRFEPYAALPGKAVRLLEEVVQRSVGLESLDTIDREDVIGAFAQRTGLPRTLISDEATLDLTDTTAFLGRRVLGQPTAVEAMVDLVAVIKAGLQDPAKPLGSYFFVGPTGVGKTELAKGIAELLFSSRTRLIRFDMGEYRSPDAVAKLIGSGWQSSAEEGELTRKVREQPFSVVLFDEIEKSHASVFDALLAVLGEGHLTDASGRTADFRNTVVIMTSNLGVADAEKKGVGFANSDTAPAETRRQRFIEAAESFFRPEFVNRIDQVVVFEPLSEPTIRQIAQREIGRLVMREGIVRRKLLVEIEDAVVEHCATAGFHPRYGARPLQRQIETTISRPLARLVVGHRAQAGDLVSFRMSNGSVLAELRQPQPPSEPSPPAQPSSKRGETSLQQARTDFDALQGRLSAQAQDASQLTVELEVERLLNLSHGPGFWDDPDTAKQTLQHYYLLERCLERFAGLRARSDGLGELMTAAERTRDHSRLDEIRDAIAEIDAAANLLALEIAGAATGMDDGSTYLFITGIGAGGREWADEVAAMYRRWAERTGRETHLVGEAGVIRVDGVASFALLQNESGLHRVVDDHDTSTLARVSVRRSLDDDAGDDDGAVIVRQYYRGRRRFVRDPRTGVRASNVSDVLLRGEIDAFLIGGATSRRS